MTEQERDNVLLELKQDMNTMKQDNKKRDSILLELKQDMNTMKQDNKKRDSILLELKQDMNTMKQDNKKRDSILLELKQDMNTMKQDIDTMKQDMNTMEQDIDSQMKKVHHELRRMSGSIAVIENDHGEKLKAIFDVLWEPLKKSEEFSQKVDSHSDKLYKHDVRISVLESKVGNL